MEKDTMLVKVYNDEVKVTWRVPSDIFKELKHKAIDENVSVNKLVSEALRQFLGMSSKKK
jgi:predicted HicB family RNase H-like nuclease